jgi:hypothetical protein
MRAVALLLLAATACAYDVPWGPGGYGPKAPYSRASPGRITLNPGADRTPAWLAGDTAVLYSVERGDPPHDRCLGVLSARSWTLERWLCHASPPSADSTDSFEWPAVRAGGKLAYQWGTTTPGSAIDLHRYLVVATLARWESRRVLATFDLGASTGLAIDGVRQLGWIGDTSIVYVHEQMGVAPNPFTGKLDTSVAPLRIERVDFGGDSAITTAVSGTAGATSVAVDDSGAAIYYTLPADTVVYRRWLASAVVDTLYAFAAGEVPTDVQVRGDRLVAVIGGDLHLVDLSTATETVVPGLGVVFGHPALSHDGHRIVVEGRASGAEPDLWRVDWL